MRSDEQSVANATIGETRSKLRKRPRSPATARNWSRSAKTEFGGRNRLIVSHGDEGHFGGVPDLLEAFDPELPVPSGARGCYHALDVEADGYLAGGGLLQGDLKVIQIPGHTVSNGAFLREADGVLIAGDVLGGSAARTAGRLSGPTCGAVQRPQSRGGRAHPREVVRVRHLDDPGQPREPRHGGPAR
ncbi:MBL fold metallo-hydrolase [Halobellus ordinarius]|uniref:MBL fold metallo-hydrolase n=1 Tax=Halobellus ordinarius TaxID=3075120 RepID=UPI0028802297|nr:MBL fold metallo-hydrolase [Halobellus sp. ZY16]